MLITDFCFSPWCHGTQVAARSFAPDVIYGVGCFKIADTILAYMVSVRDSRHHRCLIICVVIIVSVRATDTIDRLLADTIDIFCSSDSSLFEYVLRH